MAKHTVFPETMSSLLRDGLISRIFRESDDLQKTQRSGLKVLDEKAREQLPVVNFGATVSRLGGNGP